MDNFIIGDQFGEEIRLVLPGDRDRYKSLLGSILTLFTVILLTAYMVYKSNTIFSNEQSEISQVINIGAIPMD